MKTGIGFDIHRFEKGRRFMLGGIEIPFAKGLLGHSDGDVLLHSISDAILGAMGKQDIGYYFPDMDKNLKGLASVEIIKKVLSLMEAERYTIKNMDVILICEEPKLLPFFEAMRKNLSEVMNIDAGNIGLKAKTFEHIGAIGRGSACACFVSVLLGKKY